MAGARTKKQLRKKNLDLHRNQTRLNRVLEALGVTKLHKTLHITLREFLVNNPDGPLAVECRNGVVPASLLKRLEEWEKISYKGISASDFMEVMFPLVRHMNSAMGRGLMAECDGHKFKEVTKTLILQYITPYEEFAKYFVGRLGMALNLIVWEETTPDRLYVRTDFEGHRSDNRKGTFKIIVDIEPIRSVWVMGGWKYQIGTYYETLFTSFPEMRWLSKCPLDYGLHGEAGENLPVFISGHALERLRERLDDPWLQIVTMFSIYSSMDNPVYYPLNDGSGDMLVEVRLRDPEKIGYFVVCRTRNEIVIRTFLFITMRQTPEGYKLHRRLRMARPDYDFHGLDKYSTLASSDITTHPTLRPIWNSCGFGGLLTTIDEDIKIFGREPKKRAEDVIKYFQLEGA